MTNEGKRLAMDFPVQEVMEAAHGGELSYEMIAERVKVAGEPVTYSEGFMMLDDAD